MDRHWSCSVFFPIMLVAGYLMPFVFMYFVGSLLIKARRYRAAHKTFNGFWNQLGLVHKIAMAVFVVIILGFLYNELIVY